MFSKILSKVKSFLSKTSVTNETTLVNAKKTTNSAKKVKRKSKKTNSKKIIQTLKALPGVGSKSAKSLYDAGFKTTESIISADEKDLLAVPGVGVNLVKKLKSLK